MAKFYRKFEPDIKQTTVNWRIYELVKNGVLERIGRGKFRLGKTNPYEPRPSKKLVKLYNELHGFFPYTTLCIWETAWLNELQQHLINKSYTIVEIDKDVSESAFHKLQENKKTVFLEPSLEIMEKYVSVHDNAIIVKPLITEAPVQDIANAVVPTLEKILVDLYCDDQIFYFFQGRELQYIWENAFRTYSIQQDKLLRYASRRRRKDEIAGFMKKIYNPAAN